MAFVWLATSEPSCTWSKVKMDFVRQDLKSFVSWRQTGIALPRIGVHGRELDRKV